MSETQPVDSTQEDPEPAFQEVAKPPRQQRHAQAPQTSGLLKLSPEMRNMIYEAVVVSEDALWITASRRSDPTEWRPPVAIAPPITRVCRQLRAEALAMLYARNTFSACIVRKGNIKRAKRWASCVGDERIAQIRHFRLRSNYPDFTCFDVTRDDEVVIGVTNAYARQHPLDRAQQPIDTLRSSIHDMRQACGNRVMSRASDFRKLLEDFARCLGVDRVH